MISLKKLERFNLAASSVLEWISLVAFVSIMAITCIDVVGGKLFNTPLFGAIDGVMLAQFVAISLAAAMTLIADRHIQVEFFFNILPEKMQTISECIVNFLGFTLFTTIVMRLFFYGHSFKIGGEVSTTLEWPLFPFIYASALACIPVCLIFLQKLLESIIKAVKNEC